MLQLLGTLAVIYALLCGLIFVFQDRLLYHPAGPPLGDPRAYRIHYEDVSLTTCDGVQLHGWWMPRPDAIGALVFCHGNAGNIGGRLDSARAFQRMGLSVFLFDYRGYGKSQGSPDEEGTYRDAEAAPDGRADHLEYVEGHTVASLLVEVGVLDSGGVRVETSL